MPGRAIPNNSQKILSGVLGTVNSRHGTYREECWPVTLRVPFPVACRGPLPDGSRTARRRPAVPPPASARCTAGPAERRPGLTAPPPSAPRPVASSRPRSECCQPGRCQRGSGHGAGPVTRPQLAALSPRGRRATGRESCVRIAAHDFAEASSFSCSVISLRIRV